MDSPGETTSSTSQGAAKKNADVHLFHATRGSDSCSSKGLSGGGEGVEGSAEKLARLRDLLHGGCAPPECDYVQLAALGLPWCERRAPLLTRAVLARPPQV